MTGGSPGSATAPGTMNENLSDQEDDDLASAFKQLREAEQNLEEALFQAKDKLSRSSSASRVHLSELVKYAHYISTEHSVAAPLNWEPGDPRRPFPTETEMRAGWLGRLNQLPPGEPIPTHLMQEAAIRDTEQTEQPGGAFHFQMQQSMSGEQTGADVLTGGGNVPEEVETMSTDSSGSSSTTSP